MGVSTDAILFYGYCWSEEVDLFPDDEGDWQKTILRRRGERDPWDDYPSAEIQALPYAQQRARGDQWAEANRAALDAYRAKEMAIKEEFGVAVGRHCSGDCSMPYVAATETTAHRGYPKAIESLAVDSLWDAKLDRFLAEFGIDKPHESPKWWLVSYWG